MMHFFSLSDNKDQIYPENFGYYPAIFAMTFFMMTTISMVYNTHTNTDCSGKICYYYVVYKNVILIYENSYC